VKKPVPWFDQYTAAIGFSAYAFEGIGLILPVQEIVEDQKGFKKIVIYVICSCCVIYCSFGLICVSAWQENITTPLITDNLPHNAIVWSVKILFAINLVFSYPL
jgi:solute carrier family 36 (proton-coupled amino acid transporter)